MHLSAALRPWARPAALRHGASRAPCAKAGFLRRLAGVAGPECRWGRRHARQGRMHVTGAASHLVFRCCAGKQSRRATCHEARIRGQTPAPAGWALWCSRAERSNVRTAAAVEEVEFSADDEADTYIEEYTVRQRGWRSGAGVALAVGQQASLGSSPVVAACRRRQALRLGGRAWGMQAPRLTWQALPPLYTSIAPWKPLVALPCCYTGLKRGCPPALCSAGQPPGGRWLYAP